MTSIPPGWYPHPKEPEYEFYWDGTAWTGEYHPIGAERPAPAAVASAAVVPAAELVEIAPVLDGETRRPGIRALWIVLASAAAIVVAAVVVGGLLLAQPRYPQSAPLGQTDLAALVTSLGVDSTARAGDSRILLGTTPSQCGVVAQFGVSGLWSQTDVDSGLPFYQAWGFPNDHANAADPWVNARLFATPAEADAFVDQVETAARNCPVFTRPDDPTEWHDSAVGRDGDRVRITFDSATVVVASRDNAVFLFLFEGRTDDVDYVDAALAC